MLIPSGNTHHVCVAEGKVQYKINIPYTLQLKQKGKREQ